MSLNLLLRPLPLFFLLTSTLLSLPVVAEAVADDSDVPVADKPTWVERVEVSRSYVARSVQVVTGAVDDFFSQNPTQIINDSYLRVRLRSVFEEAGNRYSKNDLKLKVDLPKTEGRLKLVFESDPDEFETLEEQNQDRSTDEQTIRDTDGSVGAIRVILKQWHSWHPDLDVGVKAPLPLDPFIRFTLKRGFQLSENWHAGVRHSIYHFHSNGFGEKSRLRVGRPLGENLFLSNTTEMQWQGEGGILEFDNIVSLRHNIDERNTLTYATGVFVEEHPDPHTQSYFVDASYRHLLHKDWVYAVVRPAITWQEDTDFEAVTSLTLGLEFYFQE